MRFVGSVIALFLTDKHFDAHTLLHLCCLLGRVFSQSDAHELFKLSSFYLEPLMYSLHPEAHCLDLQRSTFVIGYSVLE